MKEMWIMMCDGWKLDTCLASSKEEATEIFRLRNKYIDWAESDILSEADYLIDLKNESELNSFECQSNEL